MSPPPLPKEKALTPGSRVDGYELVSRLAVGGMAEVYLARALGTGELVAFKRILPQHAQSDEFIQMFLDEAQLASTLCHPNLVRVYDMGTHAGSYYFTMEYVRGWDLRAIQQAARQQGRPLSIENALSIVMGAAAGLHHAHEQVDDNGQPLNIVHRDVSPANVLVTREGAVKVVDFGIAKAATRNAQTQVGTLKGKISYMSPEQCLAESVDRRSDVFALGIVLYELTTSARPFQGDNEISIWHKITHGAAPPPAALIEGYPAGLQRIVMKALQRNRSERFATAKDLQVALEELARSDALDVTSECLGRTMRSLFGDRDADAGAAYESIAVLQGEVRPRRRKGRALLIGAAAVLLAGGLVVQQGGGTENRRSNFDLPSSRGSVAPAPPVGPDAGSPVRVDQPAAALPAPSPRPRSSARSSARSSPAPRREKQHRSLGPRESSPSWNPDAPLPP
ncbi:MAG: serine/threonine protein kinase [Deltaproteobacteria bacterium]|nr:serine/threonine protein kinase [Deltaproteobacteria bacterium]